MFKGLRTWNPWFGCQHNCYRGRCWAKVRIAPRVGAGIKCALCRDFIAHSHPKRLVRIPGDPRIFVVAHGDLFGWWVPDDEIETILEACRKQKKELWFFETKDPRRYMEFVGRFPENTMLSTTIETDRGYDTTIRGETPHPIDRGKAMIQISKHLTYPLHVAIEPIMDFDLIHLLALIRDINPLKVSVGYDSLNNNLPEPPKEKTLELIEKLEKFTLVERKGGL